MKKNRVFRLFFWAGVSAYLLCSCATLPEPELRGKGAVKVRSPKAFTKPRKLALLIGVGEYKDPKWSPLKYPESDVDKLKEVLERKGNFDRILTLKGQAVTRENILISLQSLRRENKSKNDIVAIYFSGHGTLDLEHLGNMLQYFVSHEARFDAISSSALSMEKLFTIFDSFASEKKVLILASCYSGAGKSVLRADILNEIRKTKSTLTTLLPPLEKVSKASIILSSSAMGDVSYEDDNLQGDIYTHFLIEGLETGDSNQDGAVTATEAHSHARYATYIYSKGKQKPAMHYNVEGEDPINLTGEFTGHGKAVIFDYTDKFAAVDVLIDGQIKGQLPGSIAIEPGNHNIAFRRFYANSPFSQATINVKGNERLNAGEIIQSNGRLSSMPIGLRVGKFFSSDFDSTLSVEGYYKFYNDKTINGLSFDWDTGIKYLAMSVDNVTFSGYLLSNSFLMNFFTPFMPRLKAYVGPGFDIGAGNLKSSVPGFTITDSQVASPLYLNAGATYKGQNFLFTLDTKYYFSTEKSYRYVSDKFKIGNKTFGYNGPALSAGFTYFF